MILILKDCSIAQRQPHLPILRFKKNEAVECDDYIEEELVRLGFALHAELAGAFNDRGEFIPEHDVAELINQENIKEKTAEEILEEAEEVEEVEEVEEIKNKMDEQICKNAAAQQSKRGRPKNS